MTNTTKTQVLTPAQRKAAQRQRYKEEGRKAVEVWTHPNDRASLQRFAERLNARRKAREEKAKAEPMQFEPAKYWPTGASPVMSYDMKEGFWTSDNTLDATEFIPRGATCTVELEGKIHAVNYTLRRYYE